MFSLSFKISIASDRFIRLVLNCVSRPGNRSNKCKIKITKTSKNSLYIEELVSNWVLFISIVFVCGCSDDKFNTIRLVFPKNSFLFLHTVLISFCFMVYFFFLFSFFSFFTISTIAGNGSITTDTLIRVD